MSRPATPSSATAFVDSHHTASSSFYRTPSPVTPYPNPTDTTAGPSKPRTYKSHTGCSLCTLINYPAHQEGLGLGREVHRDDLVVVLEAEERAKAASGGHWVVVLNDHAGSVYDLGPADVPLLSHIASLAVELVSDAAASKLRIGFITQFRDSYFPTGHLHAHILCGPLDKASFYRRTMPYGALSWYELEDLMAEIRESTSNNRIKSGYGDSRRAAPIMKVHEAGSRFGAPNVQVDDKDNTDVQEPAPGARPRFDSVSLTDDARIERPDSAMGLLASPRLGSLEDGRSKSKGKGRDYGV